MVTISPDRKRRAALLTNDAKEGMMVRNIHSTKTGGILRRPTNWARQCRGPLGASVLILAGLALGAAPPIYAETTDPQRDKSALIDEALSAAPPQVAETAMVMDLEGNVLRKGTGAFTCFPAPPDFAGPMCLDEQWLAWMDAYMKQQPTTTSAVGFAYMLAGDSPVGGASNIEPFARTPTADNQWVVEGPHVMIIVPDAALLAGLPTTPDAEGPYVMWPGTPYAHVMWPVDERPEQRAIAGQRSPGEAVSEGKAGDTS